MCVQDAKKSRNKFLFCVQLLSTGVSFVFLFLNRANFTSCAFPMAVIFYMCVLSWALYYISSIIAIIGSYAYLLFPVLKVACWMSEWVMLDVIDWQLIGLDHITFIQKNTLDQRGRTLSIVARNESFSSRVSIIEHCFYSVSNLIVLHTSFPFFSFPACSRCICAECACWLSTTTEANCSSRQKGASWLLSMKWKELRRAGA